MPCPEHRSWGRIYDGTPCCFAFALLFYIVSYLPIEALYNDHETNPIKALSHIPRGFTVFGATCCGVYSKTAYCSGPYSLLSGQVQGLEFHDPLWFGPDHHVVIISSNIQVGMG